MSQWETILIDSGYDDHVADWSKWKYILRVTIGEACLLSMGIDPDVMDRDSRVGALVEELTHKYSKLVHPNSAVRDMLALYETINGCKYRLDGWGNTVKPATFSKDSDIGRFICELDKRYDIACANMEIYGGNLPVYLPARDMKSSDLAKAFEDAAEKTGFAAVISTSRIKADVRLSDFGAWAKEEMGWELPSEFPIGETESVFGFDDESETYPKELDIAVQAWRAVAVNEQGGTGTPKARIKTWLNKHYPDLPDSAIERVAVVCNWDKAGGNKNSGKGL